MKPFHEINSITKQVPPEVADELAMTGKQKQVCEDLAHSFHDKEFGHMEQDSVYRVCFKYGFEAAQDPKVLMLNPLVKGLVEALKKEHEFLTLRGMLDGPHHITEALAPFTEGGGA